MSKTQITLGLKSTSPQKYIVLEYDADACTVTTSLSVVRVEVKPEFIDESPIHMRVYTEHVYVTAAGIPMCATVLVTSGTADTFEILLADVAWQTLGVGDTFPPFKRYP